MLRKLFKLALILSLILMIKSLVFSCFNEYKSNIKVKEFKGDPNVYNDQILIEIPKIKLSKIVVKANDDFSNLNNNLVYYKNRDYNKKIIMFGHSGIGYGTYFNRIDELDKKDFLYLYFGKERLKYEFIRKYYILETNLDVLNERDDKKLFLITCKKNDKRKRLVIELLLKNA